MKELKFFKTESQSGTTRYVYAQVTHKGVPTRYCFTTERLRNNQWVKDETVSQLTLDDMASLIQDANNFVPVQATVDPNSDSRVKFLFFNAGSPNEELGSVNIEDDFSVKGQAAAIAGDAPEIGEAEWMTEFVKTAVNQDGFGV